MLYFPQLLTGAVSQFPIRRTVSRNTITNLLEDGSRVSLVDVGANTVKWDLTFENISDDEMNRLSLFFQATEGRLQSFTFFDPAGNLLARSEDFTQPVWQVNSLLHLQPGAADPSGTARAWVLTNTSAGDLSLVQTVNVPDNLVCCFSFYARSDVPRQTSITRVSGTATDRATAKIGANWELLSRSSQLNGALESSDFGLTIQPGASIELFGVQMQAQPGASHYAPTFGSGGVYPETRFDHDILSITATAPDRNSCKVTLISRVDE